MTQFAKSIQCTWIKYINLQVQKVLVEVILAALSLYIGIQALMMQMDPDTVSLAPSISKYKMFCPVVF